mgnify:CR=1 FL=1
MTEDNLNFTKLFEEAENVVSIIKNEKLKEIAFEKLVNHLLAGHSNKIDENRYSQKKKARINTKTAGSLRSGGQKISKDGPKTWIKELVTEGFFKKHRSSSDIREELETRSHHLSSTDLTLPLQTLCHEKLLRRKKIAPETGGKAVLHWVNW